MRKTILISGILVISAMGMNSCKKCYSCTKTVVENINNVTDSTVVLNFQECSGKNGAGDNIKITIADVEANGYICTEQ